MLATLLLAKGGAIAYVTVQLGHAKPTTTLQWYAHWLPSEKKSFVDSLDAAPVANPAPICRSMSQSR